MFNMGPAEILLIVALALIFVGPKRLPEVARQIGRLMGEVRRTTDGFRATLDKEIREEDRDARLAEFRERRTQAEIERAGATESPATDGDASEAAPKGPEWVEDPAQGGPGNSKQVTVIDPKEVDGTIQATERPAATDPSPEAASEA